jgi:hypothetical protein
MKSGASDPFGDSEDERSESSESRTESEANREREDSEDEWSESPEESSEEQGDPRDDEDERSAPSENRASPAEPAVEGGSESEGGGESAAGEPLSRDELPLVLRRDRVKDERPEVHQLFVQRETHDRAVDAERALADRLDVDLSRTDAREAIYLAGMAHLDDAEEILRTWGYDL